MPLRWDQERMGDVDLREVYIFFLFFSAVCDSRAHLSSRLCAAPG
jgi:hypothetical protein